MPKRNVGVFYPDMGVRYTEEMQAFDNPQIPVVAKRRKKKRKSKQGVDRNTDIKDYKRMKRVKTIIANANGYAQSHPNFLERGISRKYSKRVVTSDVKYTRKVKHKKDSENDQIYCRPVYGHIWRWWY